MRTCREASLWSQWQKRHTRTKRRITKAFSFTTAAFPFFGASRLLVRVPMPSSRASVALQGCSRSSAREVWKDFVEYEVVCQGDEMRLKQNGRYFCQTQVQMGVTSLARPKSLCT
uniref:Uncharacterized protein n=1 Tax=Rhipicephalus microplus TaxID=6941 RepID=A0A6G5AI81_RHIMP